jgi:hypothetical protein
MNLGKVQQQAPSRRAATALQRLDLLPANAAILDASGRIVGVNRRWKQFGQQNGLRIPHSAIGSDYLQYCGSDEPNLRAFTRDLKGLLAGRLDLLTSIYACYSATQQRWFCLIGVPLSLDKPRGVALLHVEFTAMLPPPIGSQKGRAEGQPTRQIDTPRLAACGPRHRSACVRATAPVAFRDGGDARQWWRRRDRAGGDRPHTRP